jgi:2-polyprenyl-3-methyl-5-hydroxy-6-metoxy-1,4-benzoquinol methylase
MTYTLTNGGLHDYVEAQVLKQYARPGLKAADLGSGPGAIAERLSALGFDVLAVDRDAKVFQAQLPHRTMDLNQPDFASQLGLHTFGLVTAIEVIEHVESPIGFLRNIGNMLAPGGVGVVTTPNVDSLPARLRFLVAGKIRTMDEFGDSTHISPIFYDLLQRQLLPLAKLRIREHKVFPPDGFQLSRKSIAWSMGIVASLLPGKSIIGDNHVLVLENAA